MCWFHLQWVAQELHQNCFQVPSLHQFSSVELGIIHVIKCFLWSEKWAYFAKQTYTLCPFPNPTFTFSSCSWLPVSLALSLITWVPGVTSCVQSLSKHHHCLNWIHLYFHHLTCNSKLALVHASWMHCFLTRCPWSVWGLVFRLTCSAAGHTRLLVHGQRVYSFHNRSVQTSLHLSYSFLIYRPEESNLQPNPQTEQLNARHNIYIQPCTVNIF